MVYIHRTAEDWVARGIPRKHIVNRETHPGYVDSNWPLNQNQQDLLGERGFYHLPHLQPQSVLITPIGNMWVEGGHWRCEHLFRYMVNKGYMVAKQEIGDSCIMPYDYLGPMRSSASLMALDSGFEWHFMVDTDVLLEEDTLERLLKWDRPVVTPLLIDMEKGTALSAPEPKPGTGLQPVMWTCVSAILFNTKVYNAIGADCWGANYGPTEFYLAQQLAHVGHRMYIDTNTPVNVAKPPGRPRAMTWDEYQAKLRAAWDRSRNEERDRRPPPDYDPAFGNGEISPNGAYMPNGSPYRRKALEL